MAYEVIITGDKELTSRLTTMAKEIGIGTEEILDRTADQITTMLVDKAPVFTGELKESVGIKQEGPGFRVIGPGAKYSAAVERGGGPTGLPNVSDLEDRIFYGGKRGAWAFAKYLKNTGKAFRDGTWFVKQTAVAAQGLFFTEVNHLISMITR
jgi:hypothetical protein